MKKTNSTGFIFCFFLVVLSFNASAQEYKYDISKYFTPDIVRNSLDFSFNTNNNFSNFKMALDTTQSQYYTQMNGTITPNFVSYINTRKRMSLFQINGQFYGNYYESGFLNRNNSYKQLQTNDNFGVTYSSHFYNSTNQFLSLGIASNFQASINNNSSTVNSVIGKQTYNNYFLTIAPTVGVGIGRIESVEDARQAIYILDDLSKKGVLTRPLNEEEIFQFAQQISKVKNKRFLDYRLHLIDEITTVDSMLVSNNLLNKSDARYFTSLYDNWQYGALYSRKSGQSFEITFTPSYNWNYIKYNKTETTNNSWINQNNLTGGLSFIYTYEKPVNLNWQHSVLASLNGSTNFNSSLNQYGDPNSYYGSISNNILNGFDYKSVNLNGSYTLGFYPSTRTYVNASLKQSLLLSYYKEVNSTSDSWNKTLISNIDLNFSVYYYLSQQLRLSANAGTGNHYTNDYSLNKNNQLNIWFGGTISYSFF